jgi:Protein of unknown function (DUF3455)
MNAFFFQSVDQRGLASQPLVSGQRVGNSVGGDCRARQRADCYGSCRGHPDAESPSQPRALIWEFREPIATLSSNGMSIGRHYAGPNWDYFDGSGVKGKVVASAPGATENDIPWLKLDVVEHRGDGILSNVTAVQRINTKGGVALGPCEIAGSLLIVPYSADYVFVRQN